MASSENHPGPLFVFPLAFFFLFIFLSALFLEVSLPIAAFPEKRPPRERRVQTTPACDAPWHEAASRRAVSALAACPVKNVLRSEKLGAEEPSWKAVVFSLTVTAPSERV